MAQRNNCEVGKLKSYIDRDDERNVKAILERNSDPIIIENLPILHYAASQGKQKVVKVLLELRKSDELPRDEYSETSQRTALHYAVLNANIDIVKQLLPYSDLKYLDKYCETPLELATRLYEKEKKNYEILMKPLETEEKEDVVLKCRPDYTESILPEFAKQNMEAYEAIKLILENAEEECVLRPR